MRHRSPSRSPGVTSPEQLPVSKVRPPEPNVEQKKAAYSALADVLKTTPSWQEPPSASCGKRPPRRRRSQCSSSPRRNKNGAENVTDVSRHYGKFSSRFAQLYCNLIGWPRMLHLTRNVYRRRHAVPDAGGRCFFLLAGAPVRVAAVPQNGANGDAERISIKAAGCTCR